MTKEKEAFCGKGGVAFSSERHYWETPQDLFDTLDNEFHFTLDPASTDENAKCEKHYTIEDDGLCQSWAGERVFCNPPYGRELSKWVKKAHAEVALNPGTVVVMLIPARTDTTYFHDYIYHKAEVRFIRGRLRFCIQGKAKDAAPSPSMVVVFR